MQQNQDSSGHNHQFVSGVAGRQSGIGLGSDDGEDLEWGDGNDLVY